MSDADLSRFERDDALNLRHERALATITRFLAGTFDYAEFHDGCLVCQWSPF